MTDRSPGPSGTSVESLLREEIAANLTWKVLLAIDFSRCVLIASAPFEDFSEPGRAEASRAGYGPGDSVFVEIRAERDCAPQVRVSPKNEPVTIHWVTRTELPADSRRDKSGESKKKGGCFVATAAFGSPLAAEIGVLRHLRDRHLRSHAAGALVVRWYERVGPGIASIVARSAFARSAARAAIRVVCRAVELRERTRGCDY